MKFSIYGLPQFAIGATVVFFRLYLLIYYTQVINFTGGEAGTIIASSLIISALFDPLIGKFSDHYKASKGKLTPLIIVGVFLLCLAVSLIFIPSWTAQDLLPVWFFTLLYELSYSFFLIPYLALAKELIVNRNDIVNLYSWRYFWGSFGAVVGVSLPFLKNIFQTNTYIPMGVTLIILLILLAPMSIIYLREASHTAPIEQEKQKHSLAQELITLFQNKPFLGYFLAFTFLSVGLGLNQTLAIYYYKHGLDLNDIQTNTVFTVYMLVFCLAIPFCSKFAKKHGKLNTLKLGLILSALFTFFYPFIPKQGLEYLYIIVVLGGITTSVVVLIDAYLSNIIDLHNFNRKEKKSNFTFGVWRITDKLSRALGIYLAGLVVDYTVNGTSEFFNIKDAFGFGVFLCFSIASLFLFSIKYGEAKHIKLVWILQKKYPHLIHKNENEL